LGGIKTATELVKAIKGADLTLEKAEMTPSHFVVCRKRRIAFQLGNHHSARWNFCLSLFARRTHFNRRQHDIRHARPNLTNVCQ
jgi:hypothetical protein